MLLLPPVKRLLGDPHLPDHIANCYSGLYLPQCKCNLLLRELRILYGKNPTVQNIQFCQKTIIFRVSVYRVKVLNRISPVASRHERTVVCVGL
jgi:hypothetical protein